MKDPLYSVGQMVAVMTPDLRDVFPMTTVLARRWVPPGLVVTSADGGRRRDVRNKTGKWIYGVSADPRHMYAENTLRPVNPDEYDDLPAEQEREVSA